MARSAPTNKLCVKADGYVMAMNARRALAYCRILLPHWLGLVPDFTRRIFITTMSIFGAGRCGRYLKARAFPALLALSLHQAICKGRASQECGNSCGRHSMNCGLSTLKAIIWARAKPIMYSPFRHRLLSPSVHVMARQIR